VATVRRKMCNGHCENLAKSGYKSNMKYKSFIFGYTMETKYRDLEIFIFIYFSHFWQLKTVKNIFFSDFKKIKNESFWRNFATKKKRLVNSSHKNDNVLVRNCHVFVTLG
jgi:hypothetical protein